MRYRIIAVALFTLALLSGCVLKSDYQASLAEIDSLKKDKAELENKTAALEREIADLTRQKEVLTQENINIKTTLETKRNKLAKEVFNLKNRLSENAGYIAAVDQQIKDLKGQVVQLSLEKEKAIEEKERAINRMKATYESLVGELKQEIKDGEIQITQLKDRLTVNMVDKILFDSGSTVIKSKGQKVLDRVAEILKKVTDRQIKVEGHTDNVPISSGLAEKFPTNWELSTARATTVVRYLQGRGINAGILSAEGFSEYRPVAPNDTPENKARNRRIEIVLVPLDAKTSLE